MSASSMYARAYDFHDAAVVSWAMRVSHLDQMLALAKGAAWKMNIWLSVSIDGWW